MLVDAHQQIFTQIIQVVANPPGAFKTGLELRSADPLLLLLS